eukprot:snap_masked-scaffold_1-processed-gene-27.27-mRNA-1 protein AED:1.00 eAED:1.00 QI:0/-1/0/0/-1/1/1/0/651
MKENDYKILTQKNWSCKRVRRDLFDEIRQRVRNYTGRVYEDRRHKRNPWGDSTSTSITIVKSTQSSRGQRKKLNLNFPNSARLPRRRIIEKVKQIKTHLDLDDLKEKNLADKVQIKIQFYVENKKEFRMLKKRIKTKENRQNGSVSLPTLGDGSVTLTCKQRKTGFCTPRMYETRRRVVNRKKKHLEKKKERAVLRKVNRHEILKAQVARKRVMKRKLNRNVALIKMLAKLVGVLQRIKIKVDEEREKKLLMENTRIIQRVWKRKRAQEYGRKYRNAVKVVREFVIHGKINLRYKRLRKHADTIFWSLIEVETSNFQKVVKNFRFRVCHCQRLFRSYKKITKARLLALGKMWDIYEEKILSRELKDSFESRITSEVKVAVQLLGPTRASASLNQMLLKNTFIQRVIKTCSKTNPSLRDIGGRILEVDEMPIIRKIRRISSRKKEKKRNQSTDVKFNQQMSKIVPQDLSIRLLFRNILVFVFQAPVERLIRQDFRNPNLEEFKKAIQIIDEAVENEFLLTRLPHIVKTQQIEQYLRAKRKKFKLAYTEAKRVGAATGSKAPKLNISDMKQLLQTENLIKQKKTILQKLKISNLKEDNKSWLLESLYPMRIFTFSNDIEREKQFLEMIQAAKDEVSNTRTTVDALSRDFIIEE